MRDERVAFQTGASEQILGQEGLEAAQKLPLGFRESWENSCRSILIAFDAPTGILR
jgi:hypothetical protein